MAKSPPYNVKKTIKDTKDRFKKSLAIPSLRKIFCCKAATINGKRLTMPTCLSISSYAQIIIYLKKKGSLALLYKNDEPDDFIVAEPALAPNI